MAHLQDLWFLEERSTFEKPHLWFFKEDEWAESVRRFPAPKRRLGTGGLPDMHPAAMTFVGIDFGMPRALVHGECRKTVTTQFGHFLQRFFCIEVVTANAARLISTVEEHHQFQATRRLPVSAHSAPPGVLWIWDIAGRIRRELAF
jgi:hypothetical protein